MSEHNPWQTLKTDIVYSNNWIEVKHNQILNPAGNEGIYGVVHFKNLAIGVIPLDEENNTWIVGQYRYPLNKYSWEIPEGGGIIGVDPLESAKRELVEECGIEAKYWHKLIEMDLSNSVSDELAIIYVARGLTFVPAQPDETEQLTIKKVPFAQVFEMVMNGEITDAMSVGAVLKAQHILNQEALVK